MFLPSKFLNNKPASKGFLAINFSEFAPLLVASTAFRFASTSSETTIFWQILKSADESGIFNFSKSSAW